MAQDWAGWLLMENSEKVTDRVEAVIEQREIWEGMMDRVMACRVN